MAAGDRVTQDLWLEYGSDKRPFQLARDENGAVQWFPRFVPTFAPQQSTSAFSYESVPPEIDLPMSFENWHLGAGYDDAPSVADGEDDDIVGLATHKYSYSQGVDLSYRDRAYLSPELQTGGTVETTNPKQYLWSAELGLFAHNDRYIYNWSGSAWTEVYDVGTVNKINSLFEYTNSSDTYMLAAIQGEAYVWSTDGESWSTPDSTGSVPAYRDSTTASSTSGTTLTLTAPAGLQDDDILVAYIAWGFVASVTAPVPPAGFTPLFTHAGPGNLLSRSWWKRASSESGNYDFELTEETEAVGIIAAYSGAVTSGDPFDREADNGDHAGSNTNATEVTTGISVSTPDANRLLLNFNSGYDSSAVGTWAAESSYTEREDNNDTLITVELAEKAQAAAASGLEAYGTSSVTLDNLQSLLLPLKPQTPTGAYDTQTFTVRSQASGEPLLWALKSDGDLRNATDPTTPGNWSAADSIQMSEDNKGIAGMETVNNRILVVHDEGLSGYIGTSVSSIWRPATLKLPTDAARPFVWTDNNLYFTFGSSLLQYNEEENRIVRVWPRISQIGHPELNGTITAIGGDDRSMYFALKNIAGNTYIMKGDPTRREWHTWAYRGSADCNALAVVPADSDAFHSTNPQLVIADGASGDYFILPRGGLRPEDDSNCRFDTTSDRFVYGPFVAFGAQAYNKFLNRGDIEGDDLDANDTVTLQYETPGGTATTIATANSDGRTSSKEADEVEFSTLRYKMLLNNGANTTTPVLKGAVLHATPNPPRKRSWTFTVVVSFSAQQRGGGRSGYVGDDMEDFLFSSVTKRATLYDRRGTSYIVRVLDVHGVATKDTRQGDHRAYEVSVVEI